MDPKCLLTSTDLQTRRARCQRQLSFLFIPVAVLFTYVCVLWSAAVVIPDQRCCAYLVRFCAWCCEY